MVQASRVFRVFVLFAFASIGVSAAAAEKPTPRSFDVRQHGARGDGQAMDTAAIQSAIDACAESGGGRVVFPPGRYPSGTLRLRDDVELHLAGGATLVGNPERDAYAGFERGDWGRSRWHRGLIVGEGLRNVAISGPGTIDGNKVFDPQGEEKMRGPHAILLADCQGVAIRGLTIRDASNYAILFYGSADVRVEDVIFEGGWDGVHFRGRPDAWNRNVRIAGCRFFTGDDCIAGSYIEDSVVEDCVINSSCNGVRLIGPAKRLTFQRCRFFGPGRFEHRTSRDLHRTNMLAGILIQPSSWTPTPGPLEDVEIRDVTMQNVACALHVSIRKGNTGGRVTCERLKAGGVYGQAISLESWAEEPLGEVLLRDLDVQYTPDAIVDPRLDGKPQVQSPIRQPGTGVFARKLPVWGVYGRNIRQMQLDRVRLVTTDREDDRPVIRVDVVGKLILDGVRHSPLPEGAKPVELNDVGKVERSDAEKPIEPPRMETQSNDV